MEVIKVEDLSFSYPGGERILSGISLSVNKGEVVALLGPNGSGKSTLALILSSLISGYEGKITPNDDIRRRACRIVLQNPDNQIIGESVEEDVAFTPENLMFGVDEIKSAVDRALDITNLREKRYLSPLSLSGGERQREAVASAVAVFPSLLILDESGSMLDKRHRENLLSILKRECRKGELSLLCITHDTDEIIDADRVYILSDGVIKKEGRPSEVLKYEILKENNIEVPYTVALSHELGLEETLSLSSLADEIAERCIK